MWYPLPSLIALAGWAFVFAASGPRYVLGGLATLAAGIVAFAIWSRRPGAGEAVAERNSIGQRNSQRSPELNGKAE